jgi:hypothetical protein
MTWTPERHKQARAQCDGAHPGEWVTVDAHRDAGYGNEFELIALGAEEEGDADIVLGFFYTEEDCDFCATARLDLPDALAEIERLQARLEAAERALLLIRKNESPSQIASACVAYDALVTEQEGQ